MATWGDDRDPLLARFYACVEAKWRAGAFASKAGEVLPRAQLWKLGNKNREFLYSAGLRLDEVRVEEARPSRPQAG